MTRTEKVRGTTRNTVQDTAEVARQARFGTLPEPIRLADMFQEQPATAPDPTRDTYDSDEWLTRNAL